MQTLDLNTQPTNKTVLPASHYPKYADVYICDQCERNLSKYIRRRSGHGGPAIGPEWSMCKCGKKFQTGKIEWDHMSERLRADNIRISFFISVLLAITMFIEYALAYSAHQYQSSLLWAVFAILMLPSILVLVFTFFLFQSLIRIAASIYRTRY